MVMVMGVGGVAWATVASTSRVLVVVIVCSAMGPGVGSRKKRVCRF